jgi:outer membrane lipoprotein LolB
MNPLRIFIAMSCAALLSACVAGPVREALPPIAGSPDAHQVQRETRLATKASWSLQGRVALSNGRDGGSGRIEWSQDADRYEVSLSAPITRQSWRLSGDERGAQLEGLEGGTRVGADPAGLLREATRWEIPVTALSSWVRGLRAAAEHGPALVRFGTDGRLSRIEQGGWTIDYGGWQAGAAGIDLPNRLNARRGEASVRLVIDAWGDDSGTGPGAAP